MLFSFKPFPSPQRQGVILLAVLALGLSGLGCAPKKPRRTVPGPVLQVGVPIQRQIAGTEAHSYRLPLEEDTYVRLRIDQPGADVTAKLIDPEGKEVGFFDDPQGFDEPDRLVWIARSAGDHQILVTSRAPRGTTGRYRFLLQEARSSNAQDDERLLAEKDYTKARGLLPAEDKKALTRCLQIQQRALERWTSAGDPIGQVDAWVQIAQLQSSLSQTQDALATAKSALLLARQVRYREGEARSLASLGDVYGRLGPADEAVASFSQAHSLFTALEDANWQGATLYSMGLVRRDQGRTDEALKYLAQAQSLLHRVGNGGLESSALAVQGWLASYGGENGKALDYANRALRLSESSRATWTRGGILTLLGNVSLQRGELEKALQYFTAAQRIDSIAGERLSQASDHQALGSVYFNLGDADRALKEYELASQLYEKASHQARMLVNTGLIYQKAKNDSQAALRYYQQALELYGKDPSPSGMALAYTNLGTVYALTGRAGEGLPYLLKALKIRGEIGERARQATTLLEIGTAYKALNDPRGAAKYYTDALALAKELGNTELQAECLYRWAVLDRSQGHLEAALRRIRNALSIVESVRSQVVSDKLRTSFLASKRSYYELLVSLLAQLESRKPGQYRAETLEASERARSRSLLDLLAEGNVRAEIPPELQRRDIELRARLSWLQDKLGKASAPDLEAQMDQVQDAMEQLQVEIKKNYQHYAQVRYPTPLRSDQIQSLIDDDSALLHYFVGSDASFLVVVTRKGLEIHTLPSSSVLAGEVEQLRRLIQSRGRRFLPGYRRAANRLYSVLVEPAARALAGKSRLLIAPDGPLYSLPFEALLVEERGDSYADLPYLLRQYSISYIPSASVLADLRQERAASRPAKRFLAFADPDYGGARGGTTRTASGTNESLPQLPESGKEVNRIAGLFPAGDSMLYLGGEATEQNVKQNPYLSTAPNIHFALHGGVNEIRPELSGLELKKSPPEDGRLQVFEIFGLKLNADLLTLSACQTALGKEVRGEGMVGLTRAFLYAGARSLVVSLWPVPDRSTSDFMYDMYRGLDSGKAEALRKAKLGMISSGRFSEPYYWAPFILSGDPR
ncbi:MAG: CHAT domain-containing protein [Thermoanaerobaculia bacterium]